MSVRILQGDCRDVLTTLPADSVHREVRRVLMPDGTLWLNLGDSYAAQGGPGWQGKNGQRADRRFTLVRDTVPMREASRSSYVAMAQRRIAADAPLFTRTSEAAE